MQEALKRKNQHVLVTLFLERHGKEWGLVDCRKRGREKKLIQRSDDLLSLKGGWDQRHSIGTNRQAVVTEGHGL